jgi:outer membrane protein TolC
MNFKIALALALSSISCVSQGITLEESLKLAVEYNPDFKSLQEDFKKSTEQYPSAFASNFMPKTSYTLNWQKMAKGEEALPQDPNSGRLLNSTIPVFNMGSGMASLSSAKQSIQAAKYNYYQNEQAKVYEMISLYLDVHLSKEIYNLTTDLLVASYKSLEMAQEKFKLGEGTRTDISLAESKIARAELDKLQALQNYTSNVEKFKQYFGVDVTDTVLPKLPDLAVKNEDSFYQKAVEENFMVKTAQSTLYSLKHAKKATIASNFAPNVSVSGQIATGIDQNAIDPDMSNTQKTIQLAVTVPILAKGGKEFSDVRTANMDERKAVLALDQAKRTLITQAKILWEQCLVVKNSIKTNLQNVEATSLVYEGTTQEYLVGTKSFLDVLIAQNEVFRANMEYKRSIVDDFKITYKMQEFLSKLTIKELKLQDKPFDPEKEFKKKQFRVLY